MSESDVVSTFCSRRRLTPPTSQHAATSRWKHMELWEIPDKKVVICESLAGVSWIVSLVVSVQSNYITVKKKLLQHPPQGAPTHPATGLPSGSPPRPAPPFERGGTKSIKPSGGGEGCFQLKAMTENRESRLTLEFVIDFFSRNISYKHDRCKPDSAGLHRSCKYFTSVKRCLSQQICFSQL